MMGTLWAQTQGIIPHSNAFPINAHDRATLISLDISQYPVKNSKS